MFEKFNTPYLFFANQNKSHIVNVPKKAMKTIKLKNKKIYQGIGFQTYQNLNPVERKDINNDFYYDCYTIKNNKIKIYKGFKKNINYKDIINNNINNIISINLTGRHPSTTHSISI